MHIKTALIRTYVALHKALIQSYIGFIGEPSGKNKKSFFAHWPFTNHLVTNAD